MMINPILSSSARRRMRGKKTPILLTLYGTLLFLFVLAMSFAPFNGSTITVRAMRQGMEGYVYAMSFQFILIVLVTPALTAGSIAGERERQTLDLLLVTNTGSIKIAVGKLLESFGFIVLLILSSLPTLCLSLLPGGVTFWQIAEGVLYLIATAYACLSVGLFCSALFKRTVAATVTAYLMVFAIGIVTLIPGTLGLTPVLGEESVAYGTAAYGLYSTYGLQPAGPIASGMTGAEVFFSLYWAFAMNPILGLLQLLAEQTGILNSTLAVMNMMQNGSYAVAALYRYTMVFMAGAGTVLVAVSALLVRPRRHVKRRKRSRT